MKKNVLYIMQELRKAGYEAYAVGGCVRDRIMGRDVNDYDICTSALPEEVKSVFKQHRIVDTGLQHGTVTLMLDDDGYEITTFRTDGKYTDGRRPDNVHFVRNLKEDLQRRDFTMNAIAFDGDKYVDLYGGADDIYRKTIRCVGDANTRFQEDALRILRAMRFASQLGFSIDEDTKMAMHNNKELIKKISEERISVELQKMLVGDGVYDVLHEFRDIVAVIIPEFEKCFDFDQKNPWHTYDVYEHIIHSVQNIEKNRILRLAMLLHDIGKPDTFFVDENGIGHFYGHNKASKEKAIQILKRLKFDNDTIQQVALLVEYHDREIVATKKSVRKLLSQVGENASFDLLKVKCADNLAQNRKMVVEAGCLEHLNEVGLLIEEVLLNNDCTDKKGLAINGKDLAKIGIEPSPVYGEIFDALLSKVMSDELNNTYDDLIGYVQTHYVFRAEAELDLGGNGKQKISRVDRDLDELEKNIRKEIQQICYHAKRPRGFDIQVTLKLYHLDIEIDTIQYKQ